jgi:hypothetical protein
MRQTSSPGVKDPTATVGSTPTYFSLWDVDSGNSLGTYDTAQEVWEIIRALLDANGPAYAEALDLSREDTEGNYEHVATGAELLKMAGLTQPIKTA